MIKRFVFAVILTGIAFFFTYMTYGKYVNPAEAHRSTEQISAKQRKRLPYKLIKAEPPISEPAETEPDIIPEHGDEEISVPQNGSVLATFSEPLPDEFFADAVFVGNSLIDGLRLYSGLTVCDYYAAASMTVMGASSGKGIDTGNGAQGSILQGLSNKEYGKVYMLFGINEIEYPTETFIQSYADLISSIREIQPEADFYVMSLTPVTAKVSASRAALSMERISEFNSAILELAAEMGCFYIDLCGVFADETGYLPSNASWDGVHLNTNQYQIWLEYLRTHAADTAWNSVQSRISPAGKPVMMTAE